MRITTTTLVWQLKSEVMGTKNNFFKIINLRMVLKFFFISSLFHFLCLMLDPISKLHQDVTGYKTNSPKQCTTSWHRLLRECRVPCIRCLGRMAASHLSSRKSPCPAAFPFSGAAQLLKTFLKFTLPSTFTIYTILGSTRYSNRRNILLAIFMHMDCMKTIQEEEVIF